MLKPPRAVALAEVYDAGLGERAQRVPAQGKRVRITDLGTHCRGAIFLDGTHLATEALRERIDEFSRAYDGFYLGRCDVKVPSE